MRILLTGASSFTGYWFVKALHGAGHDVTSTYTREARDAYQDDLRRRRIDELAPYSEQRFGIEFGSGKWMDLVNKERFDILCHHAADVSGYSSPEFDAARAVMRNTRNLTRTLQKMKERGCSRMVLTGTVFEGGEGAGSGGLPHFSAYGLSKAMTWEFALFACQSSGFNLGKFVIPNPFGPLEEPRFCRYLVETWQKGEVAAVRTPAYVRDNIHATLLSIAYANFVGSLSAEAGTSRIVPSGYVESQGDFALRFARAMQSRLNLECRLELLEQQEFPEPLVRIGLDTVSPLEEWSEDAAWDGIADYYAEALGIERR